MSMIHSSSALLGWRSALIAGTARCKTVRSMTYSTHARAITVRPIHSLRPALGGGEIVVSRSIGFLHGGFDEGCLASRTVGEATETDLAFSSLGAVRLHGSPGE